MTCKWFIIMVSFGPLSRVDLVVNVLLYPLTLQETNISHHGKRKISFKRALGRGYISSLKGNHLLTEVILLPPMLFPQLEPRPNRTDSAPEFLNYVFFFFFGEQLGNILCLMNSEDVYIQLKPTNMQFFGMVENDVNIKTHGLLIDLK